MYRLLLFDRKVTLNDTDKFFPRSSVHRWWNSYRKFIESRDF